MADFEAAVASSGALEVGLEERESSTTTATTTATTTPKATTSKLPGTGREATETPTAASGLEGTSGVDEFNECLASELENEHEEDKHDDEKLHEQEGRVHEALRPELHQSGPGPSLSPSPRARPESQVGEATSSDAEQEVDIANAEATSFEAANRATSSTAAAINIITTDTNTDAEHDHNAGSTNINTNANINADAENTGPAPTSTFASVSASTRAPDLLPNHFPPSSSSSPPEEERLKAVSPQNCDAPSVAEPEVEVAASTMVIPPAPTTKTATATATATDTSSNTIVLTSEQQPAAPQQPETLAQAAAAASSPNCNDSRPDHQNDPHDQIAVANLTEADIPTERKEEDFMAAAANSTADGLAAAKGDADTSAKAAAHHQEETSNVLAGTGHAPNTSSTSTCTSAACGDTAHEAPKEDCPTKRLGSSGLKCGEEEQRTLQVRKMNGEALTVFYNKATTIANLTEQIAALGGPRSFLQTIVRDTEVLEGTQTVFELDLKDDEELQVVFESAFKAFSWVPDEYTGTSTSSLRPSPSLTDKSLSLKMVVLGGHRSSKKMLVMHFVGDLSPNDPTGAIGICFSKRKLQRHDWDLELQLWDTAGQERFRYISPSYFQGTKGIVYVYDVSDKSDFNLTSEWLQLRQRQANMIPAILVGCFSEERPREVTRQEGLALAKERQIPFFEVSTKLGSGVGCEEALLTLVDAALAARGKEGQVGPHTSAASSTTTSKGSSGRRWWRTVFTRRGSRGK
mmetsp:Transcript_81452/g.179113  ORF Transcript_81452/g.179113 Transcript_81452/m.179113 type:complete len:747 (+) Transcript_81452:2023-4263(+)